MSVGGVRIRTVQPGKTIFFVLYPRNRIVPSKFPSSFRFLFFLNRCSDSRWNVFISKGAGYYNKCRSILERQEEKKRNIISRRSWRSCWKKKKKRRKIFASSLTQYNYNTHFRASIPSWLPWLTAKSCSKFPFHVITEFSLPTMTYLRIERNLSLGKISYVQLWWHSVTREYRWRRISSVRSAVRSSYKARFIVTVRNFGLERYIYIYIT